MTAEEKRLAAVEQGLAAVVAELSAFRKLVAETVPQFQIDRHERDRLALVANMRKVAALPVPERISTLAAMSAHQLDQFWKFSGQSIDVTCEMLRAATRAQRIQLIESMTLAMRDDIADRVRATEKRIRVQLAPHVRGSVEASQLGKDYTGVRLDPSSYHVETKARWERRLQRDARLADLVDSGHVTVVELSDEEARVEAARERTNLFPDERPQPANADDFDGR